MVGLTLQNWKGNKMKYHIDELKKIQEEIASSISLQDKYAINEIELVVGVDQSFLEFKKNKTKVISCCVVFDFKTLDILEDEFSVEEVDFPYIPGYLMFREGEPAVKTVRKVLRGERAVLLVDGSGIAHPRRSGLACYIGLKTGFPSIGITKSKLVGEYDANLEVGKAVPLYHEFTQVGHVLKTCDRCKPIFISPGCFISMETSLEVVRRCMMGYKLPEPLRIADKKSKEIRNLLLR